MVPTCMEELIMQNLYECIFYRNYFGHDYYNLQSSWALYKARRGGVEVAGWTVDRKTRVRFPVYLHRVWAPLMARRFKTFSDVTVTVSG